MFHSFIHFQRNGLWKDSLDAEEDYHDAEVKEKASRRNTPAHSPVGFCLLLTLLLMIMYIASAIILSLYKLCDICRFIEWKFVN